MVTRKRSDVVQLSKIRMRESYGKNSPAMLRGTA